MPSTWFASDLHLGHRNILEYDNRPFDSVKAMDVALIENWRALVKPADTVYFLGDFTMVSQKHRVDSWLKALTGNLHLIYGNHDSKAVKKHGRWLSVSPLKEIATPGRKDGHKIILCHYAMRTWRGSHYGNWHLFGHSHGRMPDDGSLSLDVGVMNWDYAPVCLEEIKLAIELKIAGGWESPILKGGLRHGEIERR